MKTGIFIVTYNVPDLLIRQIAHIKKFCKDYTDIWIIDNSSVKEKAISIHYHANRLGCNYMRTHSSSKGGSESHAFACNVSYSRQAIKYDKVLYLDHDCFPVQDFSIADILSDNPLAGIGQEKSKKYIWPGLAFIDNSKIDVKEIDFSCSIEHGLDTGGMLFTVIEKYGCTFLDEAYIENPYFTQPPYNYYSLLANSTFMHFVNASNWNKQLDNEQRINSLLNILEDYYNA